MYQNPQPLFDDLKGRYGQAYFQYEIANEANFHRLMELGLADVDFAGRTAGLPARPPLPGRGLRHRQAAGGHAGARLAGARRGPVP